MDTLPAHLDEQRVGVTLSPVLAKQVARVLRIRLACAFDRPFDEALPTREVAQRLRTTLDLCVDQLDRLDWGEPSGDVEMSAPRPLLEMIARDLLDGASEGLADPPGSKSPEAQSGRRRARWMLRAADVIGAALASEAAYPMAS